MSDPTLFHKPSWLEVCLMLRVPAPKWQAAMQRMELRWTDPQTHQPLMQNDKKGIWGLRVLGMCHQLRAFWTHGGA